MDDRNKAGRAQVPRDEISVLLVGNPNVGKSTLFNALTGLRQHTGNWPGKTVDSATGRFSYKGHQFRITDLPGTYSLSSRSPEEEITRDEICFGRWDRIIFVADAACMERNLPLVLQTLEITDRAVLCVNMMDEAERRGIRIDLDRFRRELGIPVVGVSASSRTLTPLLEALVSDEEEKKRREPGALYPEEIAVAFSPLQSLLEEFFSFDSRRASWISVRMASGDREMVERASRWCGVDLLLDEEVLQKLSVVLERLSKAGISSRSIDTLLVFHRVKISGELISAAVRYEPGGKRYPGEKIDSILNKAAVGYPLMILAMVGLLFLTICGADHMTGILEKGLFRAGDRLSELLNALRCPDVIRDVFINGAYRMLAWVVSVMAPPVLIFFPIFTFLEELGYLPRVAFALDRPFQRCGSCGKQALTMAMGLGCNAVGVTGCRIIDEPRERLLAILTNSFIPCSGRFPMLFLIVGLFLAFRSFYTALFLAVCMLISVVLTLGMTMLLSKTVFRGNSSSFVLELPPFRLPRPNQILVRSLLDRACRILGRAASAAVPAGVLLWMLSNIHLQDHTLLQTLSGALDPFGRSLGMDGVIVLAFVLGSSANETVIPIALMIYTANNGVCAALSPSAIRAILDINGWDWSTAVSVILFTLFHWPCITTLLTIRKETGSMKWTAVAALIPTACGVSLCFILHCIMSLIR